MIVKKAMSKKITSVHPETSIYEIAKILFDRNIRCLPVLGDDNKIIGIIRDENIFQQLYPNYHEYIVDISSHNYNEIEHKMKEIAKKKAKDIMSKTFSYVHPEDPMIKALSLMIVHGERQIPVLDENKKIVGIVAKGDIFDKLFKTYLKNAT
ncbi:hypothetical protein A3C23_03845 [Candidatus Roizmanbacteria bacterium RIFCSPHIGHO2_02_FULL_37_13b]|uniref:CBS domain-containing protein n=1 Tax=Candidatus Roizmanbacteria bacterium RIFCSPLOWO2_02_FULL_36_11 TaxID=1802071 RepID=A0A1F7JHZ8_9BACT|nr:MAG: hypothetical protein A3C23_03845 [Candidatus Roizmanbacteria bacterium RIFCSPHIGHO2_02_FULL_37_13b]OGK55233.1 MAG: hypothetical protein A3H78_04315 [Candidatus Roizmanbacteria bacterium RIFCSPLOWO2_02_FULL_36_11]